jgi:putative intracellular protease/amidase
MSDVTGSPQRRQPNTRLDKYIAVYVPGGHPPMVDLMDNSDLGEILNYFHDEGQLTVLLCHGPIAIRAALPNAKAFRDA